jgi:hypothetical protein
MVRFLPARAKSEFFSLSPHEERVGRESERGVSNKAPPLPGPLLRFAEEREK